MTFSNHWVKFHLNLFIRPQLIMSSHIHNRNQCWSSYMTPYGIIRSQWVKNKHIYNTWGTHILGRISWGLLCVPKPEWGIKTEARSTPQRYAPAGNKSTSFQVSMGNITLPCNTWIAKLYRKRASLIWVKSRRWGCLVTWFCYQLIAKPGNRTGAPLWPDPYVTFYWNPANATKMSEGLVKSYSVLGKQCLQQLIGL